MSRRSTVSTESSGLIATFLLRFLDELVDRIAYNVVERVKARFVNRPLSSNTPGRHGGQKGIGLKRRPLV